MPLRLLGICADLVGVVDNEEATSLGRLALKAPRQLMVRGTCHVMNINRCVLVSCSESTYPIEPYTFQSNLPHQFRSLHSLRLVSRCGSEVE